MRPLFLSTALALVAGCLAARCAAAQPGPADAAKAPPDRRPPQLVAGGEGREGTPLTLAKADIAVLVTGYVAETTMTLTFKNDLPRVLEGELVFPLPEGASVSGYGLDVNGVLVDGVPVEKQKARVTYEKEIRRRVDPGLVEQAVGNNFRTRVYPIPANGTRTIKVQYVADLTETPTADPNRPAVGYRLPLNWGQAVGECNLRVEVAKSPGVPVVQTTAARGGAEELGFKKWEERYVAQQTLLNVNFDGDLVIAVPDAARQNAVVEQRTKATQSMENLVEGKAERFRKSEHYFVINDRVLDPRAAASSVRVDKKPGRVGVLWDASLSRLDADKTREMGLLKKLLANVDPAGAVDVVAFRNVPEKPVTFPLSGGVGAILDHLAGLAYDGGTNLSALDAPRQIAVPQAGSASPQQYDYWLLFTDGLADLGAERLGKVEAPVYAVSNDAHSNHALLKRVAAESGGAYFNLQRVADEAVLAGVGNNPFSLVGVDYKEGEIADVYPRRAQPVNGRTTLSGRLLAPEAKVTLKYGYGSAVVRTADYTLKQADATPGGLVSRYWAQQKVADLSSDEEQNADDLRAVGQEFNLVTPNTSLIVLETAEQYLEHRIVPPKSRKEVYEAFTARIEGQKQQAKRTREDQLSRVVGLWNERVKWWEQEFRYPKDLKVKEGQDDVAAAPAGADGGGGVGPRSTFVGVSANTRAPARGPAPPPSPVAAPRPMPAGAAEVNTADAAESLLSTVNLTQGTSGFASGSKGEKPAEAAPALAITIKEWDPKTPYLAAMKAAGPEKAYAVYLQQRKGFLASPAFYLDCADYLLRNNQGDTGRRVLTNVAELKLANAQLLRIVAHRLAQLGDFDLAVNLFEKVQKMRPEEPQSFRDLALVLCDRADKALAGGTSEKSDPRALDDYERALELLNKVVMTHWDRFDEIELIALMEANRVVARADALPRHETLANPLDPRLLKLLDLDVRISLTWDADMTDVDLWVTEPSGEKCYYGHNRTTIGGLVSRDFTQGYGPEEYCLRRAMPGVYKIQANYYGSTQASLVGPATVQATVITNFGRADEKRRALTLRLTQTQEVVDVGSVTLGAAGAGTGPGAGSNK